MKNELWEMWSDCHENPDQQKRLASAKKSSCTPTFVDFTELSGTFKGSSGTHSTTLQTCSCIDFNRRRLPCKHMYRLAMELELINSDFSSNLADVATPKSSLSSSVKLIETLPEESQLILKEVLYATSSKKKSCVILENSPASISLVDAGFLVVSSDAFAQLNHYRRNVLNDRISNLGVELPSVKKKAEFVQWIIDTIPDKVNDICSDTIAVKVSTGIKSRKLYMYLHRKYDKEFFWSEDGSYAPLNLCL